MPSLNVWLLSVQVLSPGLRLGWATAAPALLEKLIFHLHGSTLGPCALSQVVVSSLLQHWGPEGFEQHVKDMQLGYAHRANLLHTAAGVLSLQCRIVITIMHNDHYQQNSTFIVIIISNECISTVILSCVVVVPVRVILIQQQG